MRWGVFGAVLLLVLLVACSNVPRDCAEKTDFVDRDTCILTTAIAQNESAACSGIVNENWRIWCYSDIAVNTRAATVCEKIAAELPRAYCIKGVAEAAADVTLCLMINASAAGDECWRVLSVATNTSLCANVAELKQRNRCYDDLGRATLDYLHCSNIVQDTEKRDSCLLRIGLKTDSVEACDAILTPYTAEVCYINQAIQQLDETICARIASERVRSQCEGGVDLARQHANRTQG